MHAILEIILLTAIVKLYVTVDKAKALDVKCYNPEEGSYYSPEIDACIYGTKYQSDDENFVFDDLLYCNDVSKWRNSDITMDEFEKAAKPLCDKIDKKNDSNGNVTYFYGAWVKTKNGTYKDMFLGCCKSCAMLNKFQWLIKMKNEIIALTEYGLLRQKVLISREKRNYYYDTFFTKRYKNGSDDLMSVATCQSSRFELIPVKLGNRVGFVGHFDQLDGESSLLSTTSQPYKKSLDNIGYYSSDVANKYTRNRCKNTFEVAEDSSCLIYVLPTKEYGIECCCYGSKIAQCQERVSNAITVGERTDLTLRKKTICIIDDYTMDSNYSVNFSINGIQFKGNVYNLLDAMERTFCELHLTTYHNQISMFYTSKYMHWKMATSYLEVKEFIRNKTNSNAKEEIKFNRKFDGPISITSNQSVATKVFGSDSLIDERLNAAQWFQCVNLSEWDPRSQDMLQLHCMELLPIDAQCPFAGSENSKYQHIMCCCDHHIFCNYNVDFLKRETVEQIPKLCKYSNEYQYYLHDYLYPASVNTKHSCLLHFATKKVFADLSWQLPIKDSIIYFLPGSAIRPNDFSYALLKPGQCDYLDVDLNNEYLQTRYCNESTTLLEHFKTIYLPLRLFACRCQTNVGEPPCDANMEKIIPQKAQNSDKKYYCATYTGRSTMFLKRLSKIISNELSSYCATMLQISHFGKHIEHEFSGNLARRNIVRSVKFNLAMLPYVMHMLSGDSTRLCVYLEIMSTTFCFCRNNYNNRKTPCNLNPSERGRALQLTLYELYKLKIREEVLNTMVTHTTLKTPEWCHAEGIFSTIITNEEKEQTITMSKCIKQAANFKKEENGIVICTEKIIYEECALFVDSTRDENGNEEQLICCCFDNCDSVGLQLQELHQHSLESLI